MDKLAKYIRLLKVTMMMSFITHTHMFETTPGNVCTLTASNLIFLRAYAQRVAGYNVKTVDKSQREYFMDTWENILGNKEKAFKMFNQMEKDWKFALDLGCGKKEDITSLVVTLHTKMAAFHQGWCYFLCFIYHKGTEIKPEHCRNLAAHLLIFSHLGTEEMILKFSSVTRFFQLEGNSITIISFLHHIRRLPDLCHKYLTVNNQSTQEYREAYSSIADEQYYHSLHRSLEIDIDLLHYLDGAMFSIVLGISNGLFRNRGCQGYVFDLKNLKSTWSTAVGVNQRLRGRYNVINVMREIIVWRAELVNMKRLFFIEEFERNVQNDFQVLFNGGKLVNNIKYEAE